MCWALCLWPIEFTFVLKLSIFLRHWLESHFRAQKYRERCGSFILWPWVNLSFNVSICYVLFRPSGFKPLIYFQNCTVHQKQWLVTIWTGTLYWDWPCSTLLLLCASWRRYHLGARLLARVRCWGSRGRGHHSLSSPSLKTDLWPAETAPSAAGPCPRGPGHRGPAHGETLGAQPSLDASGFESEEEVK